MKDSMFVPNKPEVDQETHLMDTGWGALLVFGGGALLMLSIWIVGLGLFVALFLIIIAMVCSSAGDTPDEEQKR